MPTVGADPPERTKGMDLSLAPGLADGLREYMAADELRGLCDALGIALPYEGGAPAYHRLALALLARPDHTLRETTALASASRNQKTSPLGVLSHATKVSVIRSSKGFRRTRKLQFGLRTADPR